MNPYGSAPKKNYWWRSSYVRAKFIQEDNTVDIFPGQIQYFFEHEVTLPGKNKQIHRLAYIKWYLSASDHQTRFHLQITDDEESCNVELWTNSFDEIRRDCIIPIHNILDRFIPSSFEIGGVCHMAVVPIRRKFHM